MNTVQNQRNLQSGNLLAANAALFEGTWTHLFGPGMAETTCRIVVDVTNDKLVAAQTPSSDGRSWINLPAAAKADLAESLFEANNVSANPAEWGLVEIESVPDWATSTQPAVVAQDSAETRKKMLRTMALNALDAAITFAADTGLLDELVATCKHPENIHDLRAAVQKEVRRLVKPF